MNYFDDERNIISLIQNYSFEKVFLPRDSLSAKIIFESIKRKSQWKYWTYNAGKSDPPPDFYSDRHNLMMEVMRIDDHSRINEKGIYINPTNIKESQRQKEIRKRIKEDRPDIDLNDLTIMINASTGLPSIQDHNYIFYRENVKRILEKHIKKIPLYRENNPGKKLIFFIFDESTGYSKVDDECLVRRGPIANESFLGDIHWYFLDRCFLEVFKNADIDYLVWFAPYKIIVSDDNTSLPNICVFDLKNYDFKETIDYPENLMISLEE